jgi:outer membrane receptor protein involved in Fe transport
MNSRTILHRLALSALCFAVLSDAFGQTVAAPTPTPTAKDDQTVVLSPFEVVPDDVGYQAGNTTSGSRLNTSLKDTAASISVFTPEFLSDIAANNISEMLAYATNVEPEFEDSNQGYNNPSARSADGTTGDFRVRGIAGSFAVDLMESAAPQDNYNVERVEISSGPNSVLFGLGSAGGLVTLTTKRANVYRNKYVGKIQLGEWWQKRYEADLNYVLIPKKLAFRAVGVDSSREGWRHWDFEDFRRGMVALTYKPTTNTTVRGSFERGTYGRHATWPWNAADQISIWRANGRPIKDTFVAATDTPLGLASFGANNRITMSEFNNTLYNFRNELQSAGLGTNQAQTLLSETDMPMAYSFNGPGAHFDQGFKNYQAAIEQRLAKNLVVELSYLHADSSASVTSWATQGNTISLRADPNLTLPDPRDPTRTIPNPRAGVYYMEGTWQPDAATFKNDVVRAMGAFEHNFGKWGLHRLTGLFETGKTKREKRDRVEILVDDNNVPLANATPENAQNQLWRRHYVTLNDFTTYYQGDPTLPVPVQPVAVTTGTTTTVKNAHYATAPTSAAANNDSTKQTDTFMLAMQNYWWNKRLVTTFGYRRDQIVFKDGITERLPATDPRVTAKQRISGEWEPTGRFNRYAYSPTTHTEGVVFHITDRYSVFYNQSTNVGPPRFDRTVLPGVPPPPTDGKGRDFGAMIDFTKDGRYFLRVTQYDTKFLRDTPIIPGGVGGGNYFTTAVANILDHLQSSGRINQAERDAHFTFFTAFMVDVISSGQELEFVANPTRQLTLRLSYSHTQRNRANYFGERDPFLTDFTAFAKSKDPGTVIASTSRTVTQELENLQAQIEDNDDIQVQSYGTRPHKGNITGRYSFTNEGRLKGLFLGGAYRYQTHNYTQLDLRVGVPTYGQKFYGQAIQAFDLFTGYNVRVPWIKSRATIQLNVKNAFNQSRVTVGRFNTDFSGYKRVYLQEPRSWRFTTTLEF